MVLDFLKKLKIDMSQQFQSNVYLKKNKSTNWKRHMHPNIAVLFTIAEAT